MADAGAFLTNDSRRRQLKDRVARFSVIAGGISVLLTLVLIFFYLLYVIVPVFSPARITSLQSFTAPLSGTQAVRLNEQNTYAFHFASDGQVSLVPLAHAAHPDTRKHLSAMAHPTSFAAALPHENAYAYGDEIGGIRVIRPLIRQGGLSVSYPLGQSYIQLDPERQPLARLAISVRDDVATLIGLTRDQRFVALTYSRSHALNTDTDVWQEQRVTMPDIPGDIKAMIATPDGRTLYVLTGQQVQAIDVQTPQAQIRLRQDVGSENATPVAMTALSGANSLLITGSDGRVTQWFEVVKDSQRQLIAARTFVAEGTAANDSTAKDSVAKDNVTKDGTAVDGAFRHLVPEYYRKGFFALQDDGQLKVFFTSDNAAPVLSQSLFSQIPDHLVVSSRANRLLAITGEQWQLFRVENPYPEVSFSSLWQKVWYEGYPEPDYVWQSTSASDEAEPKLSLMPIVFGTLKAAFYALCFAIPLALAGAVYTAYFMSTKMRRVVKPTVEIMEALPTVILGFLAGIWLAPIVENHLIGIVLCVVILPLAMMGVGLGWAALPGGWHRRVPTGLHILLLMPVSVAAVWLCFSLSPWIEQAFFAGDIRSYLTNVWGIGYDQRNALVVGIAMGFAVIPTIFTIAEDAIYSVPSHLSHGSLALGATSWQTLTRVVLLTASPGIFSAVMMGLGRAVGETMIVLMATGNTPMMDWNVLEGLRTLSATIAIEMPESEVGSAHYRVLFLAAFVLFVFTFFFNTLAEIVRQRLREKYKSL
ncbi:ABC transporter permease subunit [Photobacterium galatheae]|uniref:Phosphate ABC transporter permease n=1 Tax=Photobacterium galatheae TaxID=1654360 RepID=A0A066RNG4_9GAMM|nr:ABC transporter permease subunit [Photobacterium galatheae]KDM91904.1 phosphate ABC transporter permease [Photobacterium galatheae]MCM0147682.1 ABC transporter permease subunit [Photobacterium galatheae]